MKKMVSVNNVNMGAKFASTKKFVKNRWPDITLKKIMFLNVIIVAPLATFKKIDLMLLETIIIILQLNLLKFYQI
jgi:hypothetical protein